ncbi:MAG: SDR family oxidoreductase [Erysipelotrichaceae bacterium]|nr:SDR family oxidoreductase [Erysipelotrichaceae bacterium]
MAYSIDLKGQVVIITGGAMGIGAAMCETFAGAGAQVVIFDVCDRERAEPVLEACRKKGNDPLYLQVDIGDEEAVKENVQTVVDRFGRIDMLLNNAGINKEWDQNFAVNVKGTWYMSEACKEHLEKTGGRIVVVTSASVFSGGTGFPAYNATKAGSYALGMFLARNYAKIGVRVNIIAPAVIMSPMMVDRFGTEEAMREHYRTIMPLGKIGEPEDIANVALFLCSDMSKYLTGQLITADGGRSVIG